VRELFDVGPDSLERFLVGWYGEPDRSPGSLFAGVESVPPPLRRWFETTAAWSKLLTSQNVMLAPKRMWTEDGKRVFWVENQRVWLWGIDPAGDDPAVYDRPNNGGEAWSATGVSLSAFLLQVAVFEAIMGAREPAFAGVVASPELTAVLAPLRALPMPDWRWPAAGHRLYAGDGLLAFIGPEPAADETPQTATHHQVWLATREPDS
jgi:hypothetical protein